MPVKFWTDEPEDNRSIEEIMKAQSQPFRVGDWVVVLPEDKFYSNCEQGKAQQIIEIREECFDHEDGLPYLLSFLDGHVNMYRHIRAASPEEMPGIPVTKDNRYIGMRVRPGKDWNNGSGIVATEAHYHSSFQKGVITGIHDGSGFEDWVEVIWDGEVASRYYRTGGRLGVPSYKEGYDLYILEKY